MRHFVRETLETVLLAALLFLLLRVSVQNFRVEGASMEPALHGGEYVFVNKLAYFHLPIGRIARLLPFLSVAEDKTVYPVGAPRRGDVVVFQDPRGRERDLVKRVIALEGDVVALNGGVVHLNGRPLDEPYILALPRGQDMAPVRVPPRHVFVMGDNRLASSDSRVWGPVSLSSLVGRVWVRYWPLGEARFFGAATMLQDGTAHAGRPAAH